MARFGVIGDIHANVEALGEVLRALDADGARELLCLGDIVGINAAPNDCVEMVMSRATAVVAGNHDMLATGRLDRVPAVNQAAFAIGRTRRDLTRRSAELLSGLEPERLLPSHGVLMVHGGVGDVERYLYTDEDVRLEARRLERRYPGVWICLFGHSHSQGVFEVAGDRVRTIRPNGGPIPLRRDRTYFINPGSVDGTLRRGRQDAEFALLDTERCAVELRAVSYDQSAVEARARRAGYRIGPVSDWLYTGRRTALRAVDLVRRRGLAGALGRLVSRALPLVLLALLPTACLLDWRESSPPAADQGLDVEGPVTYQGGESDGAGPDAGASPDVGPGADLELRSDMGAPDATAPDATAPDATAPDLSADLSPPGTPCAVGGQCASGSCVDGVCCKSTCASPCMSCARPGLEGECSVVPAGEPPPPGKTCGPVTGPAGCGLTGVCDGTGACAFWSAGTICGKQKCVGKSDQLDLGAACNGAGACVGKGKVGCEPFACDAVFNDCFASCKWSSQCASGYSCSAGSCS